LIIDLLIICHRVTGSGHGMN